METSQPQLLYCSGFGKYHSNEQTAKNHKSYTKLTFDNIRYLVDNPQNLDKDGQAIRWVIPSTLLSRDAKLQEAHGSYGFLWCDIDKESPTLQQLAGILKTIIGDFDFEAYTTSTATEKNQKARILIPLVKPLSSADWQSCQQMLNERLKEKGVLTDPVNLKSNQILYLPNRGIARPDRFYDKAYSRTGNWGDPMLHWGESIKQRREAEQIKVGEIAAQNEAAISQRMALKLSGAPPDTIGAFNLAYKVEDILLQAGYAQRDSTFKHPNSKSGNFSASVKDGRVYSFSTCDPLYTNGEGAHDAFSTFTVLAHNGDRDAALKDAGDNWLMKNGESWNKVKRRGYATKKDLSTLPSLDKLEPFSLNIFSLNGNSESMESKMLSDTFVLSRIAILGQATAIYAKPNTGKTLLVIRLLILAIRSNAIKSEDIYYINADDNFKGLVHKLKLAEKYGFQMLAPGYKGFVSSEFLQYIALMIEANDASGKVIILDTLKKFTNLMDKKTSSDFMRVGREFVANGGTLILLAHTNKRRDEDKKVIFGGTSDIVDDVDCAYTLDEIEVNGVTKKVLFENIKNRGDVAREIVYSYSIACGQSYEELLESVCMLDDAAIEQAKKQKEIDDRLHKNNDAIDAITEAIRRIRRQLTCPL
jgi:hypothetical protein